MVSKDIQTPIQVIEKSFDEKLGPELIDRVDSLQISDFERLYEDVKHFEQNRVKFVQTRKPGELRPYFPGLSRGSTEAFTGKIGISDRTFLPKSDVWGITNMISGRLLYCHSLMLDDPIWALSDNLLVYAQNRDDQNLAIWRKAFSNYLTFIYHFQSLINKGIISFVGLNDVTYRHFPTWGHNLNVEELSKSIGRTRILDEIKATGNTMFTDEVAVNMAANYLFDMATVNKLVNGGVDYYLPYNFWIDILETLLNSLHTKVSKIPSIRELKLFQTFGSIEIPGIYNLGPADIVAIRENEDAFERWRSCLKKAIFRYESGPRNDDQDFKDIFEEEFIEIKSQIKEKLNAYKVLNQAKTSLKTFTLGAAASLLIYPFTQELKSNLLMASGASLIELIYNMVNSESSTQATMQHYICFGEQVNK